MIEAFGDGCPRLMIGVRRSGNRTRLTGCCFFLFFGVRSGLIGFMGFLIGLMGLMGLIGLMGLMGLIGLMGLMG